MDTSQQDGDYRDALYTHFLSQPETLRWVRAAFDRVPLAMTLRSSDQSLIWGNHSYEKLIGEPLSSLVGQPVASVLENGQNLDSDSVVADGSGTLKIDQLRYRRRDGTEFFADATVQILRDDDGNTVFFLSFLENVTDRVKLAKRQQLADVSTDISEQLSNATAESLHATISDAMRRLGRVLGAQHVLIAELGDAAPLPVASGWSDPGQLSSDASGREGSQPQTSLRKMVADLGREVHGSGRSCSVSQPGAPRILAAPLLTHEQLLVAAFDPDRSVSDAERQTLRDVAHIVGGTLDRVQAQIYFKLAFDDAPLGISLRRADSTLVAANEAYARFLGFDSAAEMVGAEAKRILDERSSSAATAIPETVAAIGHAQFERVDFVRKDGSKVTGRVHAKAVEATSGGEILVLSHVEDLTASTKNARELELSQRRFRDLVENSPAITVLATVDLDVTYVSPSIEQTGWRAEELVGHNFIDLPVAIVGNLVSELQQVVDTDEARFFDWVADGPAGRQYLHVSAVPEHNNDGDIVGIIMVAVDDTERRLSLAQLAHQASHDSVTNLPNRTLLLERLVTRLNCDESAPALFFLDLDRFKVVNDSLGHAAGDRLLQVVADRLVEAVRPDSTVARLGGDEFVIVVGGPIDEAMALAIAERIHASLAPSVEIGAHKVYVTASIGVALGGAREPDTILANADAAMYQAKAQGRDRTMIFEPSLRVFHGERIGLEAELRNAVSRREFEVHYQPEFDLESGALLGAEALVRWSHPSRGQLVAGDFIEVAEDCGLISEIGDWVLDEACSVTKRWQQDPLSAGLTMRINLSARQLARAQAVEGVAALISRNGIDPSWLSLEIAESALMADAAASLEVLNGLRRLGVRLAVDDFGTGYSSLAYLKRFPVQILKIDRSFVSGLPDNANDLAIVASIVGLAEALGLDVVAEGVETEAQVRALVKMGCLRAQGYLLGRPVPLDEFAKSYLDPAASVPRIPASRGTTLRP